MSEVAKELDRVAEVCAGLRFGTSDEGIEDGLLEPLATLLGADSVVFRAFSHGEPGRRPRRVVSLGIAAAVNESYLARYYALDPVQHWLRGLPPDPLAARGRGDGRTHERPVARDDEEFRRYRREFLVPNGFIQHLGFWVWRRSGGVWLFDAHRAGAMAFGSIERARARLVAQFIQATAGSAAYTTLPTANVTPVRSLTERESDVADLVARGLSNKQVAVALGISVRTVENHLRAVFGKLQVATRTQLVARLLERPGSTEWSDDRG